MSRSVKMIIVVIVAIVLLGLTSFILLAKFYPPLNLKLFGGEFPISLDDIQFWVKKVPRRNYYRVLAKYKKNLETTEEWLDFSHSIFFADNSGTHGFDAIFFNPEDNKIYGGGDAGDREWEWVLYYLGAGKLQGEIFEPIFPEGTNFTFHQLGSLEITSAPRNHIKIYFHGNLNKLTKEELKERILAQILKESDRKKINENK